MNKRRAKRSVLFFSAGGLLIAGVCIGCWQARQHQYVLNRQLIDALVANDGQRALTLVDAGADPNTPYKPQKPPTLKQFWSYLRHRFPAPLNDSMTGFAIACGGDWSGKNDEWPSKESEEIPLVQTMLKHGAGVNTKDQKGGTPLLWAVRSNHPRTVAMLIEHGANVNVPDNSGETPLMEAAFTQTIDIGRLLLAHGANVDAKDQYGQTALIITTDTVLPGMTSLLLEHNPDVNAKTIFGQTALYSAVQQATWNKNGPDIVRQLMAHGADPNLPSNGGKPIQMAQQAKRSDLTALMQQTKLKK